MSFLVLNLFLAFFLLQEREFLNQSKEIAVQFKANFLKDSVTNFIHEFERNKADAIELFDSKVSERENNLRDSLEDAYSLQAAERIIKSAFTSKDPREMWGYILIAYPADTVELSQNMPEDWDRSDRSLENIFCSWRAIEFPCGKFYFGVTQERLYNTMVSTVASKIHNSHFVEETYYWINEVKNYKGGKDYAVRLIHPNPRSSEGMLLSTDMQDAIGDYPYQRELEDINRDGEAFSSYYYKKKDTDNFARKITYAKLYKPYNWIVCMGSYYDDIYDSVNAIKRMKHNSLTRIIVPLSILLDLFLIAFLSMRFYEYKKEHEAVNEQTDIDPMTEARTKDFGKRELRKKFLAYKITNDSVAIMLMDVDNFKSINDANGKDAGDYVLSQLANIFTEQSRVSDILVRWEGDKFMAIFDGMKKSSCWHYSQKLLEAVSSHSFNYKGKTIQATVSLGFALFDENDKNHLQIVERAESALKEAKGAGKNRARVN